MEIKTFGSNSKGNSHLIYIGKSRILLDAGISPKKMDIDQIELSKIDAVLISHEHL